MKKHQADPELRRQIEEAAGTGRPVGAVFTIQADLATLPEPDAVEAQVSALLETVRAQTGQQPGEVQVFGNLNSFALSAPAEFVARLAQQPEVVTANASQPAEDVLIRPSGAGPWLALHRHHERSLRARTKTKREPAEKLVCLSTDLAWVPLFVRAKRLVMETGGMLSRGAIVARKFGLPAVDRADESAAAGRRDEVRA